jgi:phosphatidylserine decarboxylase
MDDIIYIDRVSGQRAVEKVYGKRALEFLYGDRCLSRLGQWAFLPWLSQYPFISAAYGFLQKMSWSARKIVPFIKAYGIDEKEFLDSPQQFTSFNDFFIRKLKATARPIAPGAHVAIIPADARYYFYENIDANAGFIVKGEKLNLATLLQDAHLAERYVGGSLLVARLCPSDYHRFHFPVDCVPSQTRLINGWLYSVNPIAIKKDIAIFTKNKRTVCELDTEQFGKVLYLEIGATNVGSICETYTPFIPQLKGAEKGYFEFGASALILLFAKDCIQFDADLLAATEQGIEMRCLLGQQMGTAKK